MSDFGDFILVFGLFFFAFSDQGIVLTGKSEISFLFEFFLFGDDFKFGSVLKDFDGIFGLLIFAACVDIFLFLSHCSNFTFKVFVLFQNGILQISKSDIVCSKLLLLCVHIDFHILIFFRGLNDVFDEWFFGTINDSPEGIVFRLGLFFLEKLDFHVHEVNLFQKVLNILVFNVEVGVETERFAFTETLKADVLIFFGMLVDLIRKKIRLLVRLTELDECILLKDELFR